MGTRQVAATAAAGGVHETTARSPEVMDRQTMEATAHPMGSPAATIGEGAAFQMEGRLEAEAQEATQEAIPEAAPPGLAPGTATAMAGSGKNRRK